MAVLNVWSILASEMTARRPRQRVPEPCLVMDEPAQVRAYLDAGSDRGALAPVYLFNTTLASALIGRGDRVVDLACGPANQLAQLAAVNPQARFIGVDLSAGMLEQASAVVAQRGLSNVEFRVGDIATLSEFADASVDVVVSTLALHHLPDRATLERAFVQMRRILKPDGRVYLSDLGALRTERAIGEFARQYADRQPEVFNLDYLNSLRAAFSVADFRAASGMLGPGVRVYSTFMVPWMVVVRTASAPPLDADRLERLKAIERAMPPHQRADLRMLRLFFALGGLGGAAARR